MQLKSHPKALWWLSLIYSLYAISYGVLFANLLLYSNQSAVIHFSEDHAFQFFAAFGTMTFVLPILGGMIADKHGFKLTAKIGLLLNIIGFICLAAVHYKSLFLLGIGLCLTGNGLALPAIWSMVGIIYGKNNSGQESGTTIFYLLFNIGFLIAFALSGPIVIQLGFSWMYALFGIGSLLAFFTLLSIQKSIPNLPITKPQYLTLSLITLCILLIAIILLSWPVIDNIVMWAITIFVFGNLIHLNYRYRKTAYKNGIQAFIYLCVLGIVGITIYNSEFGLLPEFANHAINLKLYLFKLPAEIITSLDPLFCIILGTLLSMLWLKLASVNKNPRLATKFSLGIIFPALGYLLLVFALNITSHAKISLLWLLPVFTLFVLGELLVLPIGIAMAVRLAPPDKEGFFMGAWNVMQGFSALLTSYIAYFTVIKPTQSQTQINLQYNHVFLISGIIILLLGTIAFLTRRSINCLL